MKLPLATVNVISRFSMLVTSEFKSGLDVRLRSPPFNPVVYIQDSQLSLNLSPPPLHLSLYPPLLPDSIGNHMLSFLHMDWVDTFFFNFL